MGEQGGGSPSPSRAPLCIPRTLTECPFRHLPQEPGDDAQIKAFAENYGVKFDMYSKIDVNGDDAHPLWKWMKDQPKGRGTLGK